MKKLKQKLKNWFYKDSRLVITKLGDVMPDGGHSAKVEVNMLTFNPYKTLEQTLTHKGDSAELTGSYGLNPWDIFNPFKERTNLAWLLMYNQGLMKDVTAELIHPYYGSVMVTVNNPQVGQPYAVFYNSPMEVVIPSPLVGTKLYLDENDIKSWTSEKGWKITVHRANDTDNKEFSISFK